MPLTVEVAVAGPVSVALAGNLALLVNQDDDINSVSAVARKNRLQLTADDGVVKATEECVAEFFRQTGQ